MSDKGGGRRGDEAATSDKQSDITNTRNTPPPPPSSSQDDAAYFSSRDLSQTSASQQDIFLSGGGGGSALSMSPTEQVNYTLNDDYDKPLKKTKTPLPAAENVAQEMQLRAPSNNQTIKKKKKKMMMKTRRSMSTTNSDEKRTSTKQALVLILFLIGLIVCVSTLLCLILLPSFVSNQIARKLVLKNNSLLLERWSKPNVPMFFKVWLFNVKNAQQLIEHRATKPQLEEIGPFVFNLRRQKDVISFAGDNLYYTERRVYHFNRELSCCAINTSVTIPNIPLMAVVDRALSYNLPIVGRFIPRLINRAIQSLREQLFVRKQVREILFDGYDVELLRMVSRVGSLVGLPQQSQRFALLKGRNDTWRPEQDGVWAINTGQRDRKQFGRVSSWNSYKRLPFWPAPSCNVINGSDGTLFPPPIKRSEPLYIFNQELCRTVNLVYDGPSNVRSIQAYRFVLNPSNFAHTMSATQAPSSTPAGNAAVRINPTFQNPRLIPQNAPAQIAPATTTSSNQASGALPVAQLKPPIQHGHETHATSTQNNNNNNGATRHDLKPSASEVSATSSRQADGPSRSANNAPSPLSQQEKLIRVAQELASERRPESRINSHTCFCDRKTTNLNGLNVCELDGLIDLSKCSKQAQVIFGSMPHFHNSDARLQRQVAGLKPNASRHTTYLNIEPNTGLVLGGKRRVQLNVLIKHNNEIDGFENIQDMLVPIVWFEESAEIPEESAQKFRSLYIERVRLVNWTLISLFLASIALLLIDARLFLASHYWRQFKLAGGTAQGTVGETIPASPLEREGSKLRAPLASKLVALASGKGGGGQVRETAGIGLAPPASRSSKRSGRGANLPLLRHNNSSASSSAASFHSSTLSRSSSNSTSATGEANFSSTSSSSSGGDSTAPNSPELRKWSASHTSQTQTSTPTTTRIHLSGPPALPRRPRPEVTGGSGGGDATAQNSGQPR